MSHLVWYIIWDYDNVIINYNTTHSKVTHIFLLKVFYNKTNKKEYDLQIWKHYIYNTNIIVIKNIIILKKFKEQEKLLIDILNTTALAEVAWELSLIDLTKNISG